MDAFKIKKLIAGYLFGNLTEEEKCRLEEWRQFSPKNQELFHKILSESFISQAVTANEQIRREQEWNKLAAKLTVKQYVWKRKTLRVAAAIMIPLVCGIMGWLYFRETPSKVYPRQTGQIQAVVELANGEKLLVKKDSNFNRELDYGCLMNQKDTLSFQRNSVPAGTDQAWHLIRVPEGAEYIARLEDGTSVHLNAQSCLKIPEQFSGKQREVYLEGEAYFEVTSDNDRPFVVKTVRADVAVLGTKFNVSTYPDDERWLATLVQGKVQVSRGTRRLLLSPGEQVSITESGEMSKKTVDVYPYIAWTSGRFVFHDERLDHIMQSLRRWYDFDVFYTSPEVKELHFTIDIVKYNEISELMKKIERMEKLTCKMQGKTWVISPK